MALAVLPYRQNALKLVDLIFKKSVGAKELEAGRPRQFEFGISRRYWIGLSDVGQERKWRWVGLGVELNYNYWSKGQPSHNLNTNTDAMAEHCGS